MSFYVNKQPVTDRKWFADEFLSLVPTQVFAGCFLFFSSLYVVRYRRTPVGDAMHPERRDKRPPTVKRIVIGFALLIVTWIGITAGMTFAFGCLTFGIGGAIHDLTTTTQPGRP